VAQHGKRSPRVSLAGPDAPPGAGVATAAVPVVTSIAAAPGGVSPHTWPLPDMRPNRDLAGRASTGSITRHTGSMRPADSVSRRVRYSSVTQRCGEPHYRSDGRAGGGGVPLPGSAWVDPGRADEMGVEMPLQRAFADGAGLVTRVQSETEAAVARRTTGVGAA
jgi:hypothetical protein